MARIIRAEVAMPYTSGLPRDLSMNVLHFLIPDEGGLGDFEAISAAVVDFYNDDLSGATTRISRLISAVVSRAENACTITFSDVDDDPSLPLYVHEWTLGAPLVDTSLPLEVAICLSVRATPAFPVPIRRRTGRLYLGPLVTSASSASDDVMPIVGSGLRTQLCAAMAYLADSETLDFQRWAVYSRVDGQAYEISGGWVSDEFDTQRRRQMDETARTTWTI